MGLLSPVCFINSAFSRYETGDIFGQLGVLSLLQSASKKMLFIYLRKDVIFKNSNLISVMLMISRIFWHFGSFDTSASCACIQA